MAGCHAGDSWPVAAATPWPAAGGAPAGQEIAVSSNPDLDELSLRNFCREQLTAYEVPCYVEIPVELPSYSVGGILRRELRS